MLNLQEIEDTIHQLENSDTTFNTCEKLASLYIVKEHLQNADTGMVNAENNVVSELHDILPQYNYFCEVKRKYQMQEVPKEKVITSMRKLCIEVEEFLHTLYSHTDMEEERQLLQEMVNRITF